jgi:hypothetical protein
VAWLRPRDPCVKRAWALQFNGSATSISMCADSASDAVLPVMIKKRVA